MLRGLSNNRQCFNFGLARLVPGRGHIALLPPVMSLVKPEDNLSCYVMWQRWKITKRMKMVMVVRIGKNFQGWRVRPSGHSHTLSACSFTAPLSNTYPHPPFSHSALFSDKAICECSLDLFFPSFAAVFSHHFWFQCTAVQSTVYYTYICTSV